MALNQAQLVNPPVGVRPGGVKAGSGISIAADGTISVSATGGDIPAGAVMLFIQAAAPTGWTQVTTYNDRAIRLVSGAGGATGGTIGFTTLFSATSNYSGAIQITSGNVGNTTLATTQLPSHAHSTRYSNSNVEVGATPGRTAPGVGTADTGSVGSNATHTHTLAGVTASGNFTSDFALQYVDAIVCTKD